MQNRDFEKIESVVEIREVLIGALQLILIRRFRRG